MARMRAVDAAVLILEKEGATQTFGLPGAAINPFYSAMRVVALWGDYDFKFLIEELAVGAQFNIPYIDVMVNNAYLSLIRQAQHGLDMDYWVRPSFDNINSPRAGRVRRRPRRGRRGARLQGHPGP
jgi:glyoxylate carboligase